MKNYTGYIIDYSDGNLSDQNYKWFEEELVSNNELRGNYKLFTQVNELMQGKFDLEEVLNDPDRQGIDSVANQMISEFQENPNQNKSIREFIESSLDEGDLELQKKLDNARYEAQKNDVNEVTGKWVEEWNTKNQTFDLSNERRRAFISSALNNEDHNNTRKTKRSNTYALQIAGFAAAAMIAVLVAVKTITPSDSPEQLYQAYYKPLNTYSFTSRSSTNKADQLSDAVKMYKQGQYKAAAAVFSDLLHKDSNSIFIRFFGGITQLELGDYKKAISLLNEVVTENGEYKEATQWYLGLAYLKVGETQKAKYYLKLAESEECYKDQAQALLNRLKKRGRGGKL